MRWLSDYQAKLRTAEEAVRLIDSGDRVYYGGNAAIPQALVRALASRMTCFETRLSSCWRTTGGEPRVNRRASCAATPRPCAIYCWPRYSGNGNARPPTPWWISSSTSPIASA